MSFNQISIAIVAQNLASSEFARVSADAGAMSAQITSSTLSLEGSKIAFNDAGKAAVDMGENVRAASSSMVEAQKHAEASSKSLRAMASEVRITSMMGTQIISLAADFGVLDKEAAKNLRTLTAMGSLVSTAIRWYSLLTATTTAHTAAVATNTTVESAGASQSIIMAAAHKIKAAATWVATTAQNALNISYATFLALTGVGIGVIIGAAAAMAYFASQMNAATASVQSFNGAAAGMPSSGRNIQRSQSYLVRRGVE